MSTNGENNDVSPLRELARLEKVVLSFQLRTMTNILISKKSIPFLSKLTAMTFLAFTGGIEIVIMFAVIIIAMIGWRSKSEPQHDIPKPAGQHPKPVDSKARGSDTNEIGILEWLFMSARQRRRHYYRNNYLKSDAWKRKRFVVLRRDNWRCVYCGQRATQVHHKRYAKRNIGKEPIEWLVSVCKPCHDLQHN